MSLPIDLIDEKQVSNISEAKDLAENAIVSLSQLATASIGSTAVTTYPWKGKRYPVVSTETVSYLARRIITHNTENGYTNIVACGKSGSGKTTLITTLIHRLHQQFQHKGLQYAVSWYEKMDISRMDEIIKGLEKGVNRIIVVDDASYGDRELETEEAENLMAELTYVRHTLKANIVFVLVMHYSKALGPFLRDGDVSIFTSITPIERENLAKQFGGDSRWIIKQFFTKYGSMNAEGYWYSNLDESKSIVNYTKRPFKLALVSDFGSLHFLSYPEESCAACEKRLQKTGSKSLPDSMAEKDLLRYLLDSYGPTRTRQAFKIFFWARGGVSAFEPQMRVVMNRVSEFYEGHKEEFEATLAELATVKTIDRLFRARGCKDGPLSKEERRAARREKRLMNIHEKNKLRRALLVKETSASVSASATPIASQDGGNNDSNGSA